MTPILGSYTVKLIRRLDLREFIKEVDAFSPSDAALLFDPTVFEIRVLAKDWQPTLRGKVLIPKLFDQQGSI